MIRLKKILKEATQSDYEKAKELYNQGIDLRAEYAKKHNELHTEYNRLVANIVKSSKDNVLDIVKKTYPNAKAVKLVGDDSILVQFPKDVYVTNEKSEIQKKLSDKIGIPSSVKVQGKYQKFDNSTPVKFNGFSVQLTQSYIKSLTSLPLYFNNPNDTKKLK
jgi:hypothetical protein